LYSFEVANDSSSSSLSVSEMSIIDEEAVLELVWFTPNKNFVGMSSINKDKHLIWSVVAEEQDVVVFHTFMLG
jgi:hypothetical protein